ncbi:MAG: hypothetical protein JRJ84_16865, partial [Deltaproteobacteria bacterium]|nr:hypothetical protein [Deltaproteobacteria bacterium]
RGAIAPAPAAPERAWLRIQAPESATVLVNGQEAAAEMEIPPGSAQQVEIIFEGHKTWVHTLVVEPGEVRVLVVTTSELQPEDRGEE